MGQSIETNLLTNDHNNDNDPLTKHKTQTCNLPMMTLVNHSLFLFVVVFVVYPCIRVSDVLSICLFITVNVLLLSKLVSSTSLTHF